MRDVVSAAAEDDATLAVRFDPKRGREIPLFVASLPIFSKAFYATRDFEASTLDIPLGSGAYKVGRVEPGRYIEYERVKDWWGADLPVSRGLHNFDFVRHEFFRDRDVGFEAFTAGQFLFREEFTSRIWATRYDFPAIKDGRVKKEILRDDTPSGAQGWFMNTRRAKFKDPSVRKAMILAFDFEWTNQNLMYGSYDRTHSYFQNSEMMAKGKPSPEELALLEPHRDKLPKEVFQEPFVPPITDGTGQDRKLLRGAVQLLEAAGFAIRGGRRANERGEELGIEFLLSESSFQPHHMPYIRLEM
jgi:microcin C transport system substrate-binding protein